MVKHGVDRGECVAGNTTNFATKNTPRFSTLFFGAETGLICITEMPADQRN
jgi:hypothetical protein